MPLQGLGTQALLPGSCVHPDGLIVTLEDQRGGDWTHYGLVMKHCMLCGATWTEEKDDA